MEPAEQTKTRRDWAWIGAQVLIFVFAWLLFVPWIDLFPLELDGSWYMVLPWVWKSGLRFGSDFVFTYGPWGFALQGYEPSTFKYVVIAWTLFTALLVAVLAQISRRMTLHRWAGALWVFIAICVLATPVSGMHHARLFVLCWSLLILHFYVDDRPLAFLKVALVLGIALASLGKFSVGVTAVIVVLAISVDEILRRKPPYLLGIYVVATLLLWGVAGQGLGSLIPYIRTSMLIADAYGQNMGVAGPNEARDIVLHCICAVGLWIAVAMAHFRQDKSKIRTLISLGALAVMVLLNFKVGYTRHDEHEAWSTTSLAVAAMMYAAALWPTIRAPFWRIVWVGISAGSLALAWGSQVQWSDRGLASHVMEEFASLPRRAVRAASWMSGGDAMNRAYENYLSQYRAFRPLPDIPGSVDVFSYSQRSVLANGLSYRPRPIIQSYIAYTPELSQLNADFLSSDRAPDSILFQTQPMDFHYPAMEDSLTWPVLLSRYELKDARNSLLLFDRAADHPDYGLKELQQMTGTLDEWIDVPPSQEPVWMKLGLELKPLGRLVEMVYKPSPLFLDIRTAGGSKARYRLVPGAANGGFLLSPLVNDGVTFAMLGWTRWKELLADQMISQVRITSGEWSNMPGGYKPQFNVTFSQLSLPQRDLSDVPGIADYLRFRATARSILVAQSDGAVQFVPGEQTPTALIVPGHGIIAVPVPPGAKSLHVRFGVMRQESFDPKQLVVDFRAKAEGSKTVDWQQRYDPAHNPQDRSVRDAQIPLPDPAPSRIILESTPVSGNVSIYPYWAEIEFEQ